MSRYIVVHSETGATRIFEYTIDVVAFFLGRDVTEYLILKLVPYQDDPIGYSPQNGDVFKIQNDLEDL